MTLQPIVEGDGEINRSFRRMVRAVGLLVTATETQVAVWPPGGWAAGEGQS